MGNIYFCDLTLEGLFNPSEILFPYLKNGKNDTYLTEIV
jgi:hypothetical protein